MKKYLLGLIISTMLWSGHARSVGVYCQENVTSLVQFSDGFVYFTTDKTCPNWCKIDWTVSDAVKRAFATLLTARVSGKPVISYWPNLNSCGEINAVYAIPVLVIL